MVTFLIGHQEPVVIPDSLEPVEKSHLNPPDGDSHRFSQKPNHMKTITKSLFAAGLALSAAAFAFAGPPSTFQTLNHPAQFQQLKAGDKVLYVCNQCKTVSEVTIASTAQAMDQCKEGATITCPACNAKVKVTMKGPKNQSMDHEVTYTNAKGEECFFVAKVAVKS